MKCLVRFFYVKRNLSKEMRWRSFSALIAALAVSPRTLCRGLRLHFVKVSELVEVTK